MANLLLRSWEFHDFFGCDFSVFVDLDKFDHRDDIGTSGSVHLDGQGDVCAGIGQIVKGPLLCILLL